MRILSMRSLASAICLVHISGLNNSEYEAAFFGYGAGDEPAYGYPEPTPDPAVSSRAPRQDEGLPQEEEAGDPFFRGELFAFQQDEPYLKNDSLIFWTRLFPVQTHLVTQEPWCIQAETQHCRVEGNYTTYRELHECTQNLPEGCRLRIRGIIWQPSTSSSGFLEQYTPEKYRIWKEDHHAFYYPSTLPFSVWKFLNVENHQTWLMMSRWLGMANNLERPPLVNTADSCLSRLGSVMRSYQPNYTGSRSFVENGTMHLTHLDSLLNNNQFPYIFAHELSTSHFRTIVQSRFYQNDLSIGYSMRDVYRGFAATFHANQEPHVLHGCLQIAHRPTETWHTHRTVVATGNQHGWHVQAQGDDFRHKPTYGVVMPQKSRECSEMAINCNSCHSVEDCHWCLTPNGHVCAADCNGETIRPFDSCEQADNFPLFRVEPIVPT